jgi:hypothetical protein
MSIKKAMVALRMVIMILLGVAYAMHKISNLISEV